MTATFSEKRPGETGAFNLRITTSITAYGPESGDWLSAEIEGDHKVHSHSQWQSLQREVTNVSPESEFAEVCSEAAHSKPVEFALASEREFGRSLDARDVPWQYKPRTFAVDWDEDGNFVDCFTPDFYLSASDTYVALISPDCRESNSKLRNVKLLRRHHPEIRIEIVNTGYLRH